MQQRWIRCNSCRVLLRKQLGVVAGRVRYQGESLVCRKRDKGFFIRRTMR